MSKPVQLSTSDNILELFYTALASKDNRALLRIHIPRSDVFYVRAHLQEVFPDKDMSLDYVERIMYLDGMLSRRDVLDPDRVREGVG